MDTKDKEKNSCAFIQLRRDVDPDLLRALWRRPCAWVLLSMIAHRARRSPGLEPRTGEKLETKEALVGDHKGMTRGEYRSALGFLEKSGLITTRPTSRGTVAMLVNSDVYNINPESGNHLNNQQGAQGKEQPASNHQNKQPATTRTTTKTTTKTTINKTTDKLPENQNITVGCMVESELKNHQNDQQITTEATHEQPSSRQAATTNKNEKKEKNENNHLPPTSGVGVNDMEGGLHPGGEDAADLMRLLEKYPPPKISAPKAFLASKRQKIMDSGLSGRDREDLQSLREKEERDKAKSDREIKERERALGEERDRAAEVVRDWEAYQALPPEDRKRIELRAAALVTPGSDAWKAGIATEMRRDRGVEGVGSVMRSLWGGGRK